MPSDLPTTSNHNPRLLNIPNTLTGLRVVAIPGVVALIQGHPNADRQFWAAFLFGLAFFTDLFDGMIARRTHTITKLGKILDPIADKLLVLAAMVMLVYMGRVSAVMAILLLGREIAVSGLRSLAGSEGILISSTMSGKVKTFTEGFALGFLLLGPDNRWLGVDWMGIGDILLYGAVGLALWSATIYFRDYYRGYPASA